MPFIGKSKNQSDFDVIAFGLTLGILSGLSTFIVGIISAVSGLYEPIVSFVGIGYPGYKPTLIGATIGLVWGFIDGLVSGVLIAALYNTIKNRRK